MSKSSKILRILFLGRKITRDTFRPDSFFWYSHIGWIFLASCIAFDLCNRRIIGGGYWTYTLLHYFFFLGFLGCLAECIFWLFCAAFSGRYQGIFRYLAIRAGIPATLILLYAQFVAAPLNQINWGVRGGMW